MRSALPDELDLLLVQLKPHAQEVLAMRFGLKNGGQELSYSEVARRLGLSAEGVRKIEKISLKQLHQKIAERLLPQS